jgi:ribosome-binding protein aMBF1 (putative translation factor)
MVCSEIQGESAIRSNLPKLLHPQSRSANGDFIPPSDALSHQTDALCAEVARQLRQERERRGLSMTALAQRSGISQPMISLLESGGRKPSLETLLRLALALEVSPDELLRRALRVVSRKPAPR